MAIIRNNYKITKVKDEVFPISFCEISTDSNQEPSNGLNDTKIKTEEDPEETSKVETYDSDFEWKMDDDEWDLPKPAEYEIKSEPESSSDTEVECKLEPNTRRSARLSQYPTEVGRYLEFDDYSFPKSSHATVRYPHKRPHRSNDPEGEAKIRSFVDVKCHICNEPFDAFWLVRKHFQSVHPDQKAFLICCNRKFTRRYSLLDHIEWHDRSKVHACNECGKEYKTGKILQQHINVVHLKIVTQSEFMCTKCGKIFKTTSALNKHQNVAHAENDGKSFECFICHRESFKNEYTLQRHIKYLHDPDSPKYKTTICHICSCILKVVSMKYHMQAKHSNEIKEKAKCEICQHWIVKSSMKQHMEKHKSNTGAECNICGKFFKSKLSVYKHKTVVHSTNFKFECTYCDKKFHRKVKMQEHVAVRHTRDFLFKCRVQHCGREFRSEANWKIHEKKNHPVEYEKFFKPHYLRSPKREPDMDEPSNTFNPLD